jgi:hypothetical protein
MTLVEFLLARIAEDEEVAKREPDVYACWTGAESEQDLVDASDIAPGRLLAECEAKRRIIELHHNGDEHECWEMHRGVVPLDWKPEWDGRHPGDPWAHPSLEGAEVHAGPCETLQLLALPYADHLEYREEWRPTSDSQAQHAG